MIYNGMNQPIDPTMGAMLPQVMQILQQGGYDVSQLFPTMQGAGGPQGLPPGFKTATTGTMPHLPGYKPPMPPMPGGQGWSGVSDKLEWLRQRRHGAGGGMGAMSDQETRRLSGNYQGGAPSFGSLFNSLFNRVRTPRF